MKTKKIVLTIVLVLFWAGTGLTADTDSNDARSYIGVMLDGMPLPDLLVKHLGLAPGQGIRIVNIHRDSPADKAGLERDDLIIGFEGGDVVDREQFVENVRKAGIGTEVSLEIIHLGKRKTVTLKLEGLKGDFDLKYPPEPEIVQSWRPGKIFQLKPGDEDWMEVLRDNMPSDFDVNIKKFFKELYTYKHSDGEDYTITIEGNPNDDDATISVSIGETEHRATLKEIDKLPEKYRKPAEQAVKDARKASGTRKHEMSVTTPHPSGLPFNWWSYIDRTNSHINPPVTPFGPGDQMFDAIKKQMQELQQRLDKLEKRHKEMLDPEEPDEQKPQQQKTIRHENKDEQRV